MNELAFAADLAGGAQPAAVPAPAAAALLGMGVVSLCGYGWRRRKAAAG
ncbi:MAG TPA: PEP-CTERM sorting domain-containing protein [Gemmataceae bacterium]|jgi:hypothetical protein